MQSAGTLNRLGWSIALAAIMLNAVAVASPPRTASDQPRDATAASPLGHVRHPVNARAPPYRAIGKLTGSMVCTAAIVMHPRIVLTAGHCVTGNMSVARQSNLQFRPAFQWGVGLGVFEAKVWALGTTQPPARQSLHDASRDWAILLLKGRPTGIRPLRVSNYAPNQLKSLGGRILLPSYVSGRTGAQELGVDRSCSVRDAIWDVLVHDCAAAPGASGAPLVLKDDVWYTVVGIHSGSMFVDDGRSHALRLVGNSAISVDKFAGDLRKLLERLDAEDDTEGMHSLVH